VRSGIVRHLLLLGIAAYILAIIVCVGLGWRLPFPFTSILFNPSPTFSVIAGATWLATLAFLYRAFFVSRDKTRDARRR